MSGSFDTHVPGDPADLRAAAQHLLTEVAGAVGDTADLVAAERATALGSWTGEAAGAFAGRTALLVTGADTVHRTGARLGARLLDLAAALEATLDDMARVREEAAAAGLPVRGTTVHELVVTLPVGGRPSPREAGLACVHAALEDRAAEHRRQWTSVLAGCTDDVRAAEESVLEAVAPLVSAGWHAGLVAAAAPHLAARSLDLAAARSALQERWAALRSVAEDRRPPPRPPAPPAPLSRGWQVADRGLGLVSTALDLQDVHSDVAAGEPWWQAAVSQGASMAVGAGATALGAWAGGVLGTAVLPGAGTVAGAAAGGVAGAEAGGRAGERADALVDALVEREQRERDEVERARDEARIRSLLLAGEAFAAPR